MDFEEWSEAFEAEHERRRREVEGFEGYGPRPIMAETGAECWRDYFDDGYSPAEALDEDMTYWE